MLIKKFRQRWLLFLLLLIGISGSASGDGEPQELRFDHTHGIFTALLREYVSDGLVSYGELSENRGALDIYIKVLSDVTYDQFEHFSPDERLAFLINAYNSFTIDLILRHYPISSILEIPESWDTGLWVLLDSLRTLNEIEHDLIRKKFNEPRIHFALVCAARGCPKLPSFAFRADSLDIQLKRAAGGFVGDSSRNRLERESKELYLSKIFEWYGEDFVSRWGDTSVSDSAMSVVDRSLIGVFQAYSSAQDSIFLASNPVTIRFLEYDWALNGPHP